MARVVVPVGYRAFPSRGYPQAGEGDVFDGPKEDESTPVDEFDGFVLAISSAVRFQAKGVLSVGT
jgi:hypothetical protein